MTAPTAYPLTWPVGWKRTPPWREVLFPGIAPRDYCESEIRAQYRKLARDLHPDLNPSEEAARKMAELNVARDEALQEVGRA